MTRAAVERRTGLGPSALYRVMREGRFPAPFKVRRSVGPPSDARSARSKRGLPRSPALANAPGRRLTAKDGTL